MDNIREEQKEKALINLSDFNQAAASKKARLAKKDLTKNDYYEYDETVGLLELYVALYNIEKPNLRIRLRSIAIRPSNYESMIASYDDIIAIGRLCRDEIQSDYDFSLNADASNLAASVPKPYLSFLKEGMLKANGIKGELSDLKENLNQEIINKNKAQDEITALEAEGHSLQNKILVLQEKITDLTGNESTFTTRLEALSGENTSLNNELKFFKEQAQRTEVARNSTNFHNQAETNKKTAKIWGISAVAAIICFLLVIYFVFSQSGELFQIAKDVTARSKPVEAALIHQIILIEIGKRIGARLLMVSIIVYFITFLVKNYNAQMHNYIINSHKANALRSTVDLIGTAKQDDGNDKIIIQATQAIFTPQKSGYQGAESEPNSPNLITNVIDAVSSNKKS